jgi:hypothetical protein
MEFRPEDNFLILVAIGQYLYLGWFCLGGHGLIPTTIQSGLVLCNKWLGIISYGIDQFWFETV